MEHIKLRAAFDEVRLNTSLREISDKIGVSRSTMSRYERKINKTTMDTLMRLSDYLDVPLSPDVVIDRPENMLHAMENVICADKNLTSEAKDQLVSLMNAAYHAMVKTQEQLNA